MPYPLRRTLAALILCTCCISSFYTNGQNIRLSNEKDYRRSFPLPFVDTGKPFRYTTLQQAEQNSNSSLRESQSTADCKTTTFYMHLTGGTGEKIRLYDVQTLPAGDFIACGSMETGAGGEEGLIIRMDNAGNIVSKNKLRIDGKPVLIHSVKVGPSGIIVIAGLVSNSNSIFVAQLKNDLTTAWSSVVLLKSKPSNVRMDLSVVQKVGICIAAQLQSSVYYSNMTANGELVWAKETGEIPGLKSLVGFSPLAFRTFALIVNCVRNGKAVLETLEMGSTSSIIASTHIMGDGSKDVVGLKTTGYAGVLKLLAVSQQSTGTFAVERNIMYSSAAVQTKHIYSINEPIDLAITAAIDNAGHAMGVCLPQAGKMIFIRQYADAHTTPDNTREYTVPAGSSIISVSRSFDGGYLFGLNTKDAEEVIFIKTDSSGVIAGCNYSDVGNEMVEQLNQQNTISNTGTISVNVNAVPANIALTETSLATRFDCRQNYCAPAPSSDVCLSTYFKTFRSNSYVDAFSSYYLMRNNRQVVLTQRYDRVLAGQNQVTAGLKLFDENGIFIKGVDLFLSGASSSTVCRKMDDKSIMLISYFTKDNIRFYTFTLVSDDLQIIWSKSVKTYQNYAVDSDGLPDMVKDEEGNYYMVVSNRGVNQPYSKLQVYKMDAQGNQLWLKTYELTHGYIGSSSATTTRSSLIIVCEGINVGTISLRMDKKTGAMLNSFFYDNTSGGEVYPRLLKFDNNRVYYAGNIGNSYLSMALFDTTGRPYKFRTIKSSFILRAGTVKDGMLYCDYNNYDGTKWKNILLKADSNLDIKYSNEYDVMLGAYPVGMGIGDKGSIYMGGNYSESSFYDPFLMKLNNNGEMGICGFTPVTLQTNDVNIETREVFLAPLNRAFEPADIALTFVPDDKDQITGAILCSSAPQCNSVKISGNPVICQLGTEYTFKATLNPGCTILPMWIYDTAFAAIKKATDSTITLAFKKTGTSWLTARLNTGCKYYDDSILLRIQQAPATFSLGNDTSLCPGGSLKINAGSGYRSYLWNNGSTDSSITIRDAGEYSVRIENTCGDFYNDAILVTYAVVPELTIGIDTTICAGDTLVVAASSEFASYRWFPQPLQTSKGEAVFLPARTGSVVLSALTKEACVANDTMIVTVLSFTPVYLGRDTSFCSTDSITLLAGNESTNYMWNTGSTLPQITVYSAGTYSVIAKAANGCYAKDTLVVSQTYSKPLVNLGSDFDLCTGSSRALNAGNFASYLWQNGSVDQYYSVSKPGSFWVTVVDKNKCTANDTVNVLSLLPVPGNFLEPVDSLCEYDKLKLQPWQNFNSYYWSTGSRERNIVVNKPGKYILNVTNAEGCIGSDTAIVVHKDCSNGVFLPSAFSPNKDGTNDVFRVMVFGKLTSFHLTIFNRFGQVVFSSSDPYNGWHGNHNGLPQDPGVFVYQCNYHLEGSKPAYEKGTLLLIR